MKNLTTQDTMKLEFKNLTPYLFEGDNALKIQMSDGSIAKMSTGFSYGSWVSIGYVLGNSELKPILKHLSDLTEDELEKLGRIITIFSKEESVYYIDNANDWISDEYHFQADLERSKAAIDYLYSIHADLNGLIDAGLAERKTLK